MRCKISYAIMRTTRRYANNQREVEVSLSEFKQLTIMVVWAFELLVEP